MDICYGWEFFDKFQPKDNLNVLEWKEHVANLMLQPGITHHGRVGKEELGRIRAKCGILAYPTYFREIFMIGAMEAQQAGVVPVTMELGALPETVRGGIVVEGDILTDDGKIGWLETLFGVMRREKEWRELSEKGKRHAKKYTWQKIAREWDQVFTTPRWEPLVTVYTPTVRDGWWNIMASNLASQSYKSLEWIIVDDQGEDRSKIADKYAKKYGLKIRYMKGKRRKKKRTYSLVNANNTAIEAARGELFVFLQDFVLISGTGIEQLVVASRRHPRDFIAPVDIYFHPKVKPNTKNEEDWFDGQLDVVGEFLRQNVRVKNWGIRKDLEILNFEHNYGAVPTSTLRALGGYWEFFDEALGFDDAEIIYRAFEKGYGLWIDDRNIASCLDHWGTLGKDEGGRSVNRTRRLNDPRYVWMVKQIEAGKLPLVRTQAIDDQIELLYEVPKYIKDEEVVAWVKKNLKKILASWGSYQGSASPSR